MSIVFIFARRPTITLLHLVAEAWQGSREIRGWHHVLGVLVAKSEKSDPCGIRR